jgi:hypothetical protein
MTRLLKFGFLVLFAFLTSALASDISGKWKGPLEGAGVDMVFEFKCDGSHVTGTLEDAQGKPQPISKGTLDGDKLSLSVTTEWQGSPITLVMSGTVSGDTIKLAVQTEDGGWSSNAVVKKQ